MLLALHRNSFPRHLRHADHAFGRDCEREAEIRDGRNLGAKIRIPRGRRRAKGCPSRNHRGSIESVLKSRLFILNTRNNSTFRMLYFTKNAVYTHFSSGTGCAKIACGHIKFVFFATTRCTFTFAFRIHNHSCLRQIYYLFESAITLVHLILGHYIPYPFKSRG